MQIFRASVMLFAMMFFGLLGSSGIHAQACSPGTFFVSSFVDGFSPSVPPPGGFCVEDNGAGDLDSAVGVIRFQETVSDPLAGTKQFEATARLLPGLPVIGGSNGFGVQLEELRETTLAGSSTQVVPSVSIFVQAAFHSGLPSDQGGSVTTHLELGQIPPQRVNVIASGWLTGLQFHSFGQAIYRAPSNSLVPPDGVGEIIPGAASSETVTLQVASTTQQPGSVVQVKEARATANLFVPSRECLDSNFFVSTFSGDLFVDVLPSRGFCVSDNGPADLNPSQGVIVFDQTARTLDGTRKQFKGTAKVVLGGGLAPFGVELVDFQETVLAQPSDGGRIRPIPIYVLSRFSSGVPNDLWGRVVTHIEGYTQNHVVPFDVIDQGYWAGVPRVSAGHIIGIPDSPISIEPIDVTSPVASGMLGTETVTYRYLGTSAEYGATVFITKASAVVQVAPGPAIEREIEVTPPVAENYTTEMHSVTAILDPPQEGIEVTFFIVDGPNAGVIETVETDALGRATFTYANTGGPGVDTILVVVDGVIIDAVSKVWIEDKRPPACALTGSGTDTSGHPYIEITVQDADSGLADVTAPEKINAVVDIPPFLKGTTDPLVVIATKVDKTKRSQVELQILDLAENDTFCDPVLLTLSRHTGKPESVILTDIPRQEHLVFIQNGAPGLTHLSLDVNGEKFQLGGWKEGEEREIDISSAMREGDNTITLTAHGRPGGEAVVLIHD